MVCIKCNEEKPVTEFYSSLTSCKLCHNKASKAWFLANKERDQASKREYYEENIKKFDFWRAKTRAKRLGASSFMSIEEWEIIRSALHCHWCKLELHISFTQVDHIVALCEGGQHTAENVVVACANCNIRREYERRGLNILSKEHETHQNTDDIVSQIIKRLEEKAGG